MSRGFFIFSARINSFFSKLFGKKPMVTLQQAKEYTEGDSWTDNSRLEELGWKARPIEDSIKDTVEWLNSNHM
jgi:nucleoside-diphosphate-sugar epimerase